MQARTREKMDEETINLRTDFDWPLLNEESYQPQQTEILRGGVTCSVLLCLNMSSARYERYSPILSETLAELGFLYSIKSNHGVSSQGDVVRFVNFTNLMQILGLDCLLTECSFIKDIPTRVWHSYKQCQYSPRRYPKKSLGGSILSVWKPLREFRRLPIRGLSGPIDTLDLELQTFPETLRSCCKISQTRWPAKRVCISYFHVC